jgi:outer membrane protein assembly factor BamB
MRSCVCCLLIFVCSPAWSEDWPGWRGPRGDGSSAELNVPTRWDGPSGQNIAWKTKIPGSGYSSPIISAGRIFLTACDEQEQTRLLHCLDRESGEIIWTKTVLTAPLEGMHKLNSYASGTPAADGERVFVSFLHTETSNQENGEPGELVVACYDFHGNEQWQVNVGAFASIHGFCTSPVLHKNLVIVNGDHDGESYIAALSKASGDVVWKTPREHRTRSYVTPLLRDVDGKMQAVMSGSKCVAGFDPDTGERIWWIEGPTEQFVASMVHDQHGFYLSAGFPTHHVMSIKPGGHGDVSDSHVNWHVMDAKCYVPSPVLNNGLLIVADDRGIAHCFDALDGKHLWRERLGSHFSASLLTAADLVYLITDEGLTLVLKVDRERANVVEQNELGERVYASPAISDGRLYLRGTEHLFCIGK